MSTPSEVLTDERDYRRGRSVIALIGQYLTSLRQHKGEEMAFVVSNAIVNVANFGNIGAAEYRHHREHSTQRRTSRRRPCDGRGATIPQ